MKKRNKVIYECDCGVKVENPYWSVRRGTNKGKTKLRIHNEEKHPDRLDEEDSDHKDPIVAAALEVMFSNR